MENDRPLCGFVVLVVEDDADTRESLTALIREGLGCNVLSASCGSEALAIIDSKVRVDLVFSDIMMPAMDGPHADRLKCGSVSPDSDRPGHRHDDGIG
jgi:CheY-like chemotaxis protein